MSFKKLTPLLKESLNSIGHEAPTLFQKAVLPKLKGGANIFGIAPKDSGKTDGLIISTIQKLNAQAYQDSPRALIFVKDKKSALSFNEQKEFTKVEREIKKLEQQKKELYAVPEKEMKLDDTLRKREATAQLLDVLRKKQQDVEIMMKSEIKDLTLYEFSDQASLIQPIKLLALVPGTVVLTCLISFMYLLINRVLDQSIKTKILLTQSINPKSINERNQSIKKDIKR